MNSAAVDIAAEVSQLPSKPVGVPGFGSIAVPGMSSGASTLRRALSFAGPGYLVAVGYMDPGNWATSLTGGSAFGYSLLSVVLLSNVMATLLQASPVRLAIGSGLVLAQACQRHF